MNVSWFLLVYGMTGLNLSLQGSCKYKSASKADVCKYINQSACGFTLAFNRLRWASARDTSNARPERTSQEELCAAGPDYPVIAEEEKSEHLHDLYVVHKHVHKHGEKKFRRCKPVSTVMMSRA